MTVTAQVPSQRVEAVGRSKRLGRRASRRQLTAGWTGYLFVLPALAVFSVFVLRPLGPDVLAIVLHLEWPHAAEVGWLGELRRPVHEPELRSAFEHAAFLIVFISLIPVAIGLLLATAISRAHLRGMTFFRTILFFPQVLPLVVVGVIWDWMYQPDGPVNSALRAWARFLRTHAWLGDFTWSLPAVGVIGTWVTYGFAMVLFIAGVQKIPTSLYDACRVDGCGVVREFFAVTLPGLRNEMIVAFTITIIAALRTFDVIYVTTQGGPGTSTTVPALEIYRNAFQYNEVGAAAAVAMALAVIIFAVTVLILVRGERKSA